MSELEARISEQAAEIEKLKNEIEVGAVKAKALGDYTVVCKQRNEDILRAEAAEARVAHFEQQRNCEQALTAKIQAIVHEFHGEGERWSDWDVLPSGVALIVDAVRAAEARAAEAGHALGVKETELILAREQLAICERSRAELQEKLHTLLARLGDTSGMECGHGEPLCLPCELCGAGAVDAARSQGEQQ